MNISSEITINLPFNSEAVFGSLKDRVDGKFRGLKDQWANRKLYHYYRCPKCRQKLRVPRGRGRIQISCPRCGTQFIKKS